MKLIRVIHDYPIGTEVHLTDDYPGVYRKIHGYEWFGKTGNIVFFDGTKLDMDRLVIIVDVVREK